MNDIARQFVEQVLSGIPLTDQQGLDILSANGSDLTSFMAGAQSLKEKYFGNQVFLCSIINAKSGRCAENCAFCAQSSHFETQIPTYPLKSRDEIVAGARNAQQSGSTCFGIVTSGTGPSPGEEFNTILEAIRVIRSETRIEPSASLGILNEQMANALAAAGCVTYHHNLETARSFFPEICSTHDYEEDVESVRLAQKSGMQVCCGGILGLGETLEQRIEFARTLRELDVDSIPLNFLNPIEGTPLADRNELTPLDCLRIITLFRFFLPDKRISICGGREANLRELQSWMFMAGASGSMVGNYLTTSGRDLSVDLQLFYDLEVEINEC
ncbi:MAG: biotin synthase BioB [Desulfuromonadales bacterium]|nr:biotin synthase BioB [Desulfuromonadales bacterium]